MSHLLLNLLMLLVHQLLLISVGVLGTRRIVSGSCLGFTQCLCSTSSSAPAAQAEEEMSNVYPSVSCQNGSFSSVPWFFDPQLKSLYLPFNALSSFSLSKGLYPSLSILDVSHNHITSLDFSYCPRLRSINLSWNDLEELTGPALLGLPLLTHLNLAHNALARVHLTAFIHVPRLISLDLSNNFLSDLHFLNGSLIDGNESWPFQSLEMLNLAGNKLSGVTLCSLLVLPSLTVLDISRALSPLNLSCLMNSHILPNIHHLSAASCSLRHLDLDFIVNIMDNGSSLRMLNLTDNEIGQLMYSSEILPIKLSQHPKLTIDLARNPINCDCSFYRLYLDLGDQFEERFHGLSCLKKSSRIDDLAILQAHCFPTPSFLFPLVISLLLFILLLGSSVVLIVYFRRKKRKKALYPPLRWHTGCKSIEYDDGTRDQLNICRSDSTSSSHLSPEVDVKLYLDVADSEDQQENIYATIDDFYLNRDHIEAAQRLTISNKLQPVTEL